MAPLAEAFVRVHVEKDTFEKELKELSETRKVINVARNISETVSKHYSERFSQVVEDNITKSTRSTAQSITKLFKDTGNKSAEEFSKSYETVSITKTRELLDRISKEAAAYHAQSGKTSSEEFSRVFVTDTLKRVRDLFRQISIDSVQSSQTTGRTSGSEFSRLFSEESQKKLRESIQKTLNEVNSLSRTEGSDSGSQFSEEFSRHISEKVVQDFRKALENVKNQSSQAGSDSADRFNTNLEPRIIQEFNKIAQRQRIISQTSGEESGSLFLKGFNQEAKVLQEINSTMDKAKESSRVGGEKSGATFSQSFHTASSGQIKGTLDKIVNDSSSSGSVAGNKAGTNFGNALANSVGPRWSSQLVGLTAKSEAAGAASGTMFGNRFSYQAGPFLAQLLDLMVFEGQKKSQIAGAASGGNFGQNFKAKADPHAEAVFKKIRESSVASGSQGGKNSGTSFGSNFYTSSNSWIKNLLDDLTFSALTATTRSGQASGAQWGRTFKNSSDPWVNAFFAGVLGQSNFKGNQAGFQAGQAWGRTFGTFADPSVRKFFQGFISAGGSGGGTGGRVTGAAFSGGFDPHRRGETLGHFLGVGTVRGWRKALGGWSPLAFLLPAIKLDVLLHILPLVQQIAHAFVGAFAMLPAVFFTVGASAITFKMIFSGMGKVFQALANNDAKALEKALAKLTPPARQFAQTIIEIMPQIRQLQMAMQSSFFSQIVGPIQLLVVSLFPALRIGLLGITLGLAEGARLFLGWLGSIKTVRDLGLAFQGVRTILFTISQAIAPLSRAMLNLVVAAMPGLNQIAAVLVRWVRTFDAWIQRLRQTGELQAFFNRTATTFEQLAVIIENVARIITGIFKIPLGPNNILDKIGEFTGRIAAWVNSGIGQQAIVQFIDMAKRILAVVIVSAALGGAFKLITSSILFLMTPLGRLMAILSFLSASITAVFFGTGLLALKIQNLAFVLEFVRNGFGRVWDTIVRVGIPALQNLGNILLGALTAGWGRVRQAVEQNSGSLNLIFVAMKTFVNFIFNVVVPVFARVWAGAITLVSKLLAFMITNLAGFIAGFRAAWAGFSVLIQNAASHVLPALQKALQSIEKFYRSNKQELQFLANVIILAIKTFGTFLALTIGSTLIVWLSGLVVALKAVTFAFKVLNFYVEASKEAFRIFGGPLGNIALKILEMQSKGALVGIGAQMRFLGNMTKVTSDAVEEFRNQLVIANPRAEIWNNTIGRLGDKSLNSSQRLQLLDQAQQEFFGSAQAADRAAMEYEASIDNMSEAFKNNTAQQKGNKISLDIHTAAGRANRQAIIDRIKASVAMYQTDIAAGGSVEEATRKHYRRIFALIGEMKQSGATKKETENLIRTYGQVPTNIQTVYQLFGTDKALQQLDSVRLRMDAIRLMAQFPNITAGQAAKIAQSGLRQNTVVPGRSSGLRVGGGISREKGGPIPGPPSMKDNTLISAATGEYVINTKSTRKHFPLIEAINKDNLDGFASGGLVRRPAWHFNHNMDVTKFMLYHTKKREMSPDVQAVLNYLPTGPTGPYLGKSGANSVSAILAIAKQFYSGARVSSGLRRTPDYHGRGLAADLIGGGASGMAAIARGFYNSYYNRLIELIHSGGGGFFVKNGNKVGAGYYRSVIPQHFNHVHVAARKDALAPRPGAGLQLEAGTGAGADMNVARIAYQAAQNQRASGKVLLALFEAGWVESRMRNLNYGDRDSVGFLQQRPSQGWPSPMNVWSAAGSFVSRARNLELTTRQRYPTAGRLAQAVQRSAFPLRYDEARGTAVSLIRRINPAYSPGNYSVGGPVRFDQGGWLPPRSTTLAVNGTHNWEPVGMGGTTIQEGAIMMTFNVQGDVGPREVNYIREAVRGEFSELLRELRTGIRR